MQALAKAKILSTWINPALPRIFPNTTSSIVAKIRMPKRIRSLALYAKRNAGEFWIACSAHNLMKLVRFMERQQPTA